MPCARYLDLMVEVDAAVHQVEITHDQLSKCNLQGGLHSHNPIQTTLRPTKCFTQKIFAQNENVQLSFSCSIEIY